ncbi:MAG: hypothetical protein ACI81Y_001817 [Glaciecola sp.]
MLMPDVQLPREGIIIIKLLINNCFHTICFF